MAQLTLRDVAKSFNGVDVIKNIDLDIGDGEFVVFVGPSGCGKSTLLRMIAGLEEISGGIISIGSDVVNDVPPAKRGVAMVFQTYALYPHMSVYNNMAFGLKQGRTPRDEIEARVKAAAAILEIENLLDRTPRALSGGQRQRVAIGRAIVREPDVFLFDEPLSNLDAALRVQTRIEIARLHKRLGTTMVYVTHDQVEAMTLADKIVVLNSGKVEQVGSPLELYQRPNTLFVAGFIGSPKMNFMTGKIATDKGADVCGIRPEHIALSEIKGDFSGIVRHVEMLGADTLFHIETADYGMMVISQPTVSSNLGGINIYLTLQSDYLHFFKDGVRLETGAD